MQDPVHGFIEITPYISTIIDTPIFQRLGYVKQLTSAYQVFPGATHTRKEHCIGAMHLARLYNKVLFDEEDKTLILSALLHDISHGAWSHSWDSTVFSLIYPGVHKGHDLHRYRIVREMLHDKLGSVDPENIINIWNGKNKLLSAIVQGPLSTDRMDFLSRDTFYTGCRHFGILEIERIIFNSSIQINANNEKVLAYNKKIIPDVIQGLTSRLYMYRHIYLHKTVISASILIEAMIKTSIDTCNWVERTNDLEKFVYLNDNILSEIMNSTNPDLNRSRYYADRLYKRILPKMISEDIIYLTTPHINHIPGIVINDNEITWISRILTNDFCNEFKKYDIHVVTDSDIVSFEKYWNKNYPNYNVETFYIKRVYTF